MKSTNFPKILQNPNGQNLIKEFYINSDDTPETSSQLRGNSGIIDPMNVNNNNFRITNPNKHCFNSNNQQTREEIIEDDSKDPNDDFENISCASEDSIVVVGGDAIPDYQEDSSNITHKHKPSIFNQGLETLKNFANSINIDSLISTNGHPIADSQKDSSHSNLDPNSGLLDKGFEKLKTFVSGMHIDEKLQFLFPSPIEENPARIEEPIESPISIQLPEELPSPVQINKSNKGSPIQPIYVIPEASESKEHSEDMIHNRLAEKEKILNPGNELKSNIQAYTLKSIEASDNLQESRNSSLNESFYSANENGEYSPSSKASPTQFNQADDIEGELKLQESLYGAPQEEEE